MLKARQLIVVRMQGLEGLTGKVVWTNGKRAGVKFERPLYGPVVEHIVRVQLAAAPATCNAPSPAPARGGLRRV